MHIGFITPELPGITAYSGGIGTSISNLSKRLVKRGVECTVFVIDQPEEKTTTIEGVRVITLARKSIPLITFYVARKHYASRINVYTNKLKIDALEAPDWTGITAFCTFKVPLVIRVHGSDTYFCYLEKRSQKKKNFWFEKNAWRRADFHIAVSAFSADLSVKLLGDCGEVTVIPNGVDLSYFTPNHDHIEADTILYFGTVIRKKGVLAFAKAYNKIIEEYPEARWIVIGKDATDTTTRSSTKSLVKDYLSEEALARTDFIGLLPYNEVRLHIERAAVVVLPSYAEAFPMTWLEAMAMEKPIVASDIGWSKEMMEDGETGWLVHPDLQDKLSQKTLMLLRNPEEASHMGKRARAVVREHFNIDLIVSRNIDFYTSKIDK